MSFRARSLATLRSVGREWQFSAKKTCTSLAAPYVVGGTLRQACEEGHSQKEASMDVIKFKDQKSSRINIVRDIKMSADGEELLITLGTLSIRPDGKLDARSRGGVIVKIPGGRITTV
jgi:hypothetical protein